MNTEKLNKVLLVIIAVLLFIILAGSIAGILLKNKAEPADFNNLGKAENLAPPENNKDIEYFNLNTMRISPKADNSSKDSQLSSVMVVTPWLAYPTGDTVFYEEIARKQTLIKSIFNSYFSTRTKNQILSETEDNIIDSLLKQINSKLSLGRISNIYFTDYIFLE